MPPLTPAESDHLDTLARTVTDTDWLDPITRRAVEAGYRAGRAVLDQPAATGPAERRALAGLAREVCGGYAPTRRVTDAVLAGYRAGREAAVLDTPSPSAGELPAAVVNPAYCSRVGGVWLVEARCPEGHPVYHGGGSGVQFDPAYIGPRVSHCRYRRPTREHPACTHGDYVLTLPGAPA